MKCAVNSPFRYPQFNVGSMKYGLAHEAQGNEQYCNYLKTQVESGEYVILDNAADELGEGVSGQGLWDLVLEVGPQELILPDVLQDGEKTLKNSFDFYSRFLSNTNFIHNSLMVVPQGKTFEEYMHCYTEFQKWGNHRIIGIPYDIEFDVDIASVPRLVGTSAYDFSVVSEADTKTQKRQKRRLNLVRYLLRTGKVDRRIHLLGTNNLRELYTYRDFRSWYIRSNDTTAPFAAASVGRTFYFETSGEKDWPALDFDVRWDREEEKFALRNLFFYVLACNDMQAMYNFSLVNDQSLFRGLFTPVWNKFQNME